MKIQFRALMAIAIVAGIITRGVAQDTPPAPVAPTNVASPTAVPPAEPAKGGTARPKPVKRAAVKPAIKKAEARSAPQSEPVLHPEPGVARQNNVNVRGQASINSEVITHLQKNQPITLLEEITLKKAKQDEPARWFRIALPTTVGVWVHSSFVDADTKTVKPRRLNLRGGPGENYSVLGHLEKGAVINQVEVKDGWLKIEPPTNSFGFVAAHLVERAPAAPVIAATPPPPVTPPVVQAEPPPVVAQVPPATPDVAPGAPVTPPAAVTPPVATPPPVAVTPAPAEVLPDEPIEKVKKVVSREGVLRGSVSIQAPSHYELRSLDTGKTINYVFSPSTNLMLKEFKGKRIVVTGEELLDERWHKTPVIIIDTFEVVP